jgi:hypothetical protein
LADLVAAEKATILNKAILRTGYMSEVFFPAAKASDLSKEAQAYNDNIFDNPKHELAGDRKAAAIWAALQGIETPKFTQTTAKNVKVSRAAVIVPVNSKFYEWPKDGEIKADTAYICVNQGEMAFVDAEGNKAHFGNLTTVNVRPATEDEMEALVDGLLKVRPVRIIKSLGDALEGVELGND